MTFRTALEKIDPVPDSGPYLAGKYIPEKSLPPDFFGRSHNLETLIIKVNVLKVSYLALLRGSPNI